MFLYTPSTALIMRSPGDLNLAQWLIGELDKPAPLNSSNPEFRSGSDDVTRVFGIKQPISVQELQKLVTSVRSATEVKRAFTLSAKNAIVIRGTPAQIRKAQTMLEGR